MEFPKLGSFNHLPYLVPSIFYGTPKTRFIQPPFSHPTGGFHLWNPQNPVPSTTPSPQKGENMKNKKRVKKKRWGRKKITKKHASQAFRAALSLRSSCSCLSSSRRLSSSDLAARAGWEPKGKRGNQGQGSERPKENRNNTREIRREMPRQYTQVNKQQKRGRAVVPPMGLRRQSLILVACIIMAV